MNTKFKSIMLSVMALSCLGIFVMLIMAQFSDITPKVGAAEARTVSAPVRPAEFTQRLTQPEADARAGTLLANWKEYNSSGTYNFTSCYPDIGLNHKKAEDSGIDGNPEYPSKDGDSFIGSNGIQILSMGVRRYEGASLTDFANREMEYAVINRDAEEDRAVLKKRQQGSDWMSFYTQGNTKIVWQKIIEKDFYFLSVTVEYPVSKLNEFEQAVQQIDACTAEVLDV